MRFAVSMDFEPNGDGSTTGLGEALDWFDAAVPRGTIFATRDAAEAFGERLAELSNSHELAVHVHPLEFGHEHDVLARLDPDEQRRLVRETRTAIAAATGTPADELTAFRAGRHAASETTFDVLAGLGFAVDASVNRTYRAHLPAAITDRHGPFRLDCGLLELPTTSAVVPLLSRTGLAAPLWRRVTATASTVRADRGLTTGDRRLRAALAAARPEVVSIYVHPYDVTGYHADLPNAGETFRARCEGLLSMCSAYVTATDTESIIGV